MFQRPSLSTRSARRLRVFAVSFGMFTMLFVAGVAALVMSGATADAASYNLTSTTPVTNWSDILRWNSGSGTTYPGQSPGDVVTVTIGGGTLNIDVAVPNPVQVNMLTAMPVTVPTNGSLTLAASSSATSMNTFTINGGTLGVVSGANLSSWQAPIAINSGTFNVAGSLAMAAGSSFTFNGGTITGGGTVKIPLSHSASFTGSGGVMTLSNVTFDNAGTVSFSSTANPLNINSGAVLLNESGATFNYSSSQPINSDGVSSPKISNSGTVNISSGLSPTINSGLDNAGTVNLLDTGSAQTLTLAGGGTQTGTFSYANSNSILRLSGGTHGLNAGVNIPPLSTLEVTGGTVGLNTNVSVGTLNLSGGTLSGPSTISAATLNWNGGTISGLSGTGGVSVSTTANVMGAATTLTNAGALTILNSATAHYQPTAAMAVNTGGTIDNYGTWQFENNIGMTSDLQLYNSTQAPQFFNLAGTISKAVAGATTVGVPFTTSGNINLSTGADLELGGGATFNGGTLTFASAADILGIPSGVANVPNVSSFAVTGPGTFRLSGTGFMTDAKGLSLPNFEIDSGAGLSESSTLAVTTAMKSTGAVINGGGTVSLAGSATGDLTSLASSFSLNNITFTNAGTINYNPAFPIAFTGSALFNNLGTLNITGAGGTSTSGVGNSFTNTGTITRSGTPTYFTFDVPFTNSGTVSVTGANDFIAFNGGGSMSAGTMQGTLSTAGIEFGAGTFNVTGGGFGTAGGVKVNGGTLNINANVTAPAGFALLSGTLAGTGTLTLPSGSTGNISGGTISSTTLTAAAGSTLNFDTTSGSPAINTSTINVNSSATANWSGTNTLAISGASTINNAGTFNLNSDATMSSPSFATINNTGLFRKAAGTGVSSINPQVINTGSGITQVQTGTMAFYNGGSIGGGSTLIVNTGATAQFAAGTWDFNSGAVSASNGTFLINGANVNVNFLFSIGFLHLVGGTLTVPTSQTLTVGGAITLDGGTISGAGVTQMNNPSGTITVNAGNSTAITNGQTLRNYGATTYNSQVAFPMMLTNGGVFENELGATFTATQTGSVGGDSLTGTAFRNFGTVTRGGGTSTRFDAPFINGGTVNPGTGSILFMNGGSSTGTLSPASGTTLEFGSGNFQITGGSLAFASGSTMKVSGGLLQLNVAGSVPTLLLAGGTLQDNSGLSFAGGTWSGGTLTGIASSQNTGTLAVSGSSAAMSLNAHTLTNSGTINYQPSSFSLSLDNAATISNSGIATFDLKNDSPITSTGATSSINNSGTFKKSAGTASSVSANLNNSGTVLASSGTMTFNNFTQTAGTTTLGPGNVGATAITFSGGSLTGSGSLVGNVSVGNAAISPGGVSPGAITVNGNYTQSGGTFNTRIAGVGASNFDHLDATGAMTLSGGTLNASFLGGFSPASGNTFDVLTFASESGDFATKNLPTFPAGGSMSASYTPTSLRLAATVTQADVQVQQSGASSVLHNQNDVVTITVSNLGTTPANGVTISDTFSGAAFVSANASQGTCTVPSGGTFTCNLGTLNGTSSATITVTLNANAVGTITNGASVGATTFDPNSGNNTSSYSASVLASSDLGVVVTDSPDPVVANGNITYTATVSNAGPDASGSIPVTVTISGGTIISIGATGPCSPVNATTYNCTLTALASGGSSNISVLAQATSPTLVQLNATINYTQDPNTANNAASQSTTVNASADLAITKTGPASAAAGTVVSYDIVVTNNGPSIANGVVISDTAPSRLQFVSMSSTSGCTAFPCNIGVLTAGATTSIQVHYKVTPGAPVSITNTASVTSSTQDANTANNTATATTQITCPSQTPQLTGPIANATNVPTTGVITWSNAGFASYNVYFGKKGTVCNSTTATATVSGTSFNYSSLDSNTDYEVRIEGISNGCANVTSACMTFKTGVNCAVQPSPVSPINVTAGSPVHFAWTLVPGATQYEVFLSNGSSATSLGVTGDTSLDANVGNGAASWYVVATVPGCGTVTGPSATFNVCNDSTAPVAAVVAGAASGQSFNVVWDPIPGATKYEIDEATNAQFTDVNTLTVTVTSVPYTHNAQNAPQAYFYRVRAFGGCKQTFSAYSQTVRIVIAPLPKNQSNSNVNVPAGSKTAVSIDVFIPGIPGGTFNFFATGDKPWITVTPSSGVLTPDGVTLKASADPADLPNGTFTGTVLLTLTPLSVSNSSAHSTATGSTVSVPVSISLVTPVSPASPTAAANALVIPSVGHLDGLDSHWQSDIRLANTSFAAQKYSLTFNPSDNSGVKTTTINVEPGATVALDDIVKNWYGIGDLGEAANGVLTVRPITADSSALTKLLAATVASSRTYNVSAAGTLGQFIPAIPFSNFVGAAASVKDIPQILSLQQIAQSEQYRTNFGVVEASGQPASVLLSVFNAAGTKLKDISLSVQPFQQLQLNSMLASNGITNLADGRVEAKVVGGTGKVTAYASVVDNNTQDPLLVSGVPLNTTTSKDYVLPGVADLKSPFASWQTDMRVFNSGAAPQLVTLTFYPLGNSGTPQTTTMSINPGEVKTLDNALQTLFGTAAANLGGAIHVSTLTDSNLVVTGRTFNRTDTGTYGQFIPAVTPADAAGNGGRTLQILQVEDSPRYRTNLGIAEVTGKPVTVEVTVTLPDSRVSPRVEIPLAANEYRQEAILTEMGLGNVYNARIALRVIGGDGKIAAYGSVIDRQTQDPTYVPAQ